jgi:hypothetical protein
MNSFCKKNIHGICDLKIKIYKIMLFLRLSDFVWHKNMFQLLRKNAYYFYYVVYRFINYFVSYVT